MTVLRVFGADFFSRSIFTAPSAFFFFLVLVFVLGVVCFLRAFTHRSYRPLNAVGGGGGAIFLFELLLL